MIPNKLGTASAAILPHSLLNRPTQFEYYAKKLRRACRRYFRRKSIESIKERLRLMWIKETHLKEVVKIQ